MALKYPIITHFIRYLKEIFYRINYQQIDIYFKIYYFQQILCIIRVIIFKIIL